MQTAQSLRDHYRQVRERVDPRPVSVARIPAVVAPPPPVADAPATKLQVPTPARPKSDAKLFPIAFIIEQTAEHFGVTVEELKGHGRKATLMRPRHIAMYIARKLTSRSFPEIASRFDGRDHTTVLHAVRKIEKAMNGNPLLRKDLKEIEEEFLLRTAPHQTALELEDDMHDSNADAGDLH